MSKYIVARANIIVFAVLSLTTDDPLQKKPSRESRCSPRRRKWRDRAGAAVRRGRLRQSASKRPLETSMPTECAAPLADREEMSDPGIGIGQEQQLDQAPTRKVPYRIAIHKLLNYE